MTTEIRVGDLVKVTRGAAKRSRIWGRVIELFSYDGDDGVPVPFARIKSPGWEASAFPLASLAKVSLLEVAKLLALRWVGVTKGDIEIR